LRSGLRLSRGGRRRWWRYISLLLGLVIPDQLDVVAREETGLATGVGTHPPVLINHLDVGYYITLNELDLVILSLLVVILDHSTVTSLRLLRLLSNRLRGRSRRRSAPRLGLGLRLRAGLTIQGAGSSSSSDTSGSSYSKASSRTAGKAGT
jgi:hypothetical protein